MMSQPSVAQTDLQVIPSLSDNDRRELLALARRVICDSLTGEAEPLDLITGLPPRLQEPGASFVSLRRGGQPLGTVGSLDPSGAIGQDVADHAISAAFEDPRIPPITADDLDGLAVQVSVLGPLVPTGATSHQELCRVLCPGVDGLVVELDSRRVTFLPAVWKDVRDVDDFLALLWRKAGIAAGTWPSGLRTWTYRAETLSDQSPG